MNFNDFKEIYEGAMKVEEVTDKLYGMGVNIIDFPLLQQMYKIQSMLLKECYGEEGLDWFNWFVYEKQLADCPEKIKAYDKDDNPICETVEALWEMLEKDYKKTQKSE